MRDKNIDIGVLIEQYKEKRGIGTVELSDKTGISRTTLYRYVKGITGIPTDNLNKIMRVLNIPSQEIHPDSQVRDVQSSLDLEGDYSNDDVEDALNETFKKIQNVSDKFLKGEINYKHVDFIEYCVENLDEDEIEKAYNILKQVFE